MAMRMKMLKRLRLPTNSNISDRYVPSQSPLKAYSVDGAYVGSKNCGGGEGQRNGRANSRHRLRLVGWSVVVRARGARAGGGCWRFVRVQMPVPSGYTAVQYLVAYRICPKTAISGVELNLVLWRKRCPPEVWYKAAVVRFRVNEHQHTHNTHTRTHTPK